MKSRTHFNSRCLTLADQALGDDPVRFTDRDRDELALALQCTIDNFITMRIANRVESEAQLGPQLYLVGSPDDDQRH